MSHRVARRVHPIRRVILLLMLLLLPAVTPAPSRAQQANPQFVPGEVIVAWTPGTDRIPDVAPVPGRLAPDRQNPAHQAAVAAIARETGLPVLHAVPEYGMARLSVRAGAEAAESARLQRLPWVLYAEPNYYLYAAGDVLTPDDPGYPLQWNMARVAAPVAWGATLGAPTVIVAVLDTGAAQAHPDLAGRLLPGLDYVNADTNPEDDHNPGHGTHVTGIIVAGFGNGIGVVGLAPEIKVLPLKVLAANGSGTQYNIGQAIRYAADYGAQIINLSLTAPGDDILHSLESAVSYAIAARGRLVVAAGGNAGTSGNPVTYPAAYPDVLAVGASDQNDSAAPYSEHHPYIAIAAPGGTATTDIRTRIYSTTRDSYGYMAGTSMSTPMVSAAAALVWTLRPDASFQEVAGILKSTADKVGTDPSGALLSYVTGRNDYFGYGRLNAGKAVRLAYPPSVSTGAASQWFLAGVPLMTQSRTIEISNPSSQTVLWSSTVPEGAGWLSVSPADGASGYGVPGQLTLTVDAGTLAPGAYAGRVHVEPSFPAGLTSFDVAVQLRVAQSVRQLRFPMVFVTQ